MSEIAKLEVCVDTAEGLDAAVAGGADRIELCSALDLGGLTPTPGLVARASRAPIPVHAMIRPRAGSFHLSAADLEAMLTEIRFIRAAGLAGVVIGAARPDGRLDLAALHRLVEAAKGLDVTLHRVFDLVPDPDEALEGAVELGVARILTSGCARTAAEGLTILKRLCRRAGGRLSIMPGSGIRAENVARVVAETGASEVHASCRAAIGAGDPRHVAFGFSPALSFATSAEMVREMRAALAVSPSG